MLDLAEAIRKAAAPVNVAASFLHGNDFASGSAKRPTDRPRNPSRNRQCPAPPLSLYGTSEEHSNETVA
jgi:hypothetical protein